MIDWIETNPLARLSDSRRADRLLILLGGMRIGHHRDEYFGAVHVQSGRK